MRSTLDVEQAFQTQLVDNTRKLASNQTLTLKQKLAAIQLAVKQNSAKLAALRRSHEIANDEQSLVRIDRFIALRERAAAYLVATAKWLVTAQDHPLKLRQKPRNLAVPRWTHESERAAEQRETEVPLVESSS